MTVIVTDAGLRPDCTRASWPLADLTDQTAVDLSNTDDPPRWPTAWTGCPDPRRLPRLQRRARLHHCPPPARDGLQGPLRAAVR
jgi:hypothetical protein